jgi:hypothetical protein
MSVPHSVLNANQFMEAVCMGLKWEPKHFTDKKFKEVEMLKNMIA